jgi:hypothetical protein
MRELARLGLVDSERLEDLPCVVRVRCTDRDAQSFHEVDGAARDRSGS